QGGTPRSARSLNCLRSESRFARGVAELLRGRFRNGNGYFLPFLRADGEACGATYGRWRRDVCDELHRREQGCAELQCDGTGKGSTRGGVPVSRLRTWPQGRARSRDFAWATEDARGLWH